MARAVIEIYHWDSVNALVLMESFTPMLTELLSTHTEVHSIQGFGELRRLPNFSFITPYIPSAVALVVPHVSRNQDITILDLTSYICTVFGFIYSNSVSLTHHREDYWCHSFVKHTSCFC